MVKALALAACFLPLPLHSPSCCAGVIDEEDHVLVNPSKAHLALGQELLLVAPSKYKASGGPALALP